MQEEANANINEGQIENELSPAPVIDHRYFEVGGDVLSKPNALCDLMESLGLPPTCIFCNSPSDADLVDVVLKKRGISSLKLIGHVPPMRAARAIKQAKSGEVCCLVITDVSGQSLDVEELDVVVNYALPSDPEVYIHRCGHSRPGAKLAKVISLIGALDIAHLHYLKKVVDFSIEKGELPSPESIAAARLDGLRKQAVEQANALTDDPMAKLADAVLADKESRAVVALLLRNTLELIPSLQASSNRSEREEEHDDRGGRNQRGGDRDFNRGGRGRGRDFDDDYGSQGDGREDRRQDRNRRERNHLPPEKHTRVYVGQGHTQGVSESQLRELVEQHCNVPASSVKNSKVRAQYSFFDVPEDCAELVINALETVDIGGKKMFVRKATTVSVPRPMEQHNEESHGDSAQASESHVDDGM